MFTLKSENYNTRIRKPKAITLIISGIDEETIDVVTPGDGTHKQAAEWLEWYAPSVPYKYPGAFIARMYYENDLIATVMF